MRNHTRNSSGSQAEGCSPRHSMMLSIPKFFILGILVASSSAFTTIDTTSRTCTSHRSTSLFYRDSSDVHEPSTSIKKKTASDFTQRMKSIVQKRPVPRLENMKTATSLEEYANVIEEARESKRMVVVKFHAVWCKKCHSLRPAFNKMAATNPDTIFLDVPVTETNANLHKGLGVETVPYSHIYHPELGLVEETKLSRETFSEFVDLVEMHSS